VIQKSRYNVKSLAKILCRVNSRTAAIGGPATDPWSCL
jgi:hypothetical protein